MSSGLAPMVKAISSGSSAAIAFSCGLRIPPGSQSLGAEPVTARFWNMSGAVQPPPGRSFANWAAQEMSLASPKSELHSGGPV